MTKYDELKLRALMRLKSRLNYLKNLKFSLDRWIRYRQIDCESTSPIGNSLWKKGPNYELVVHN